LKNFYKFIPAISIISKKNLLKFKNVIGKKTYKYLLSKPENTNIDTIYDYKPAKLYKKNYPV
jgi:CMP-N-acetylneuraminic acid synthetase